MRALTAAVFALTLAGAGSPAAAQGFSVVMDCGPTSTAQIRTMLFFGLSKPKGSVSELEWQLFLRDEVTPRFPDGLTAWDARGQWRAPAGSLEHEQSKVLLLVHPDTPTARQSIQQVIAAYRKAFEQQAVLWETARVCVAS
jgi:hypothetical protein